MWKDLLKPTVAQPALFDYRALRLFIGFVAVTLPVVLPIWAGLGDLLTSMSAYYYTASRDLLVGSLSAIAVLMAAYNGKSVLDRRVSKAAGAFALGVAFLPVAPEDPTPAEKTVGILHYLSAVGLFSILAFFCFYLFPVTRRRPAGERTTKQRRRDFVYRSCGAVIVGCMVLIWSTRLMPDDFVTRVKPIFFLEWCALTAFGVSWFTAGKWALVRFLVDDDEAFHVW